MRKALIILSLLLFVGAASSAVIEGTQIVDRDETATYDIQITFNQDVSKVNLSYPSNFNYQFDTQTNNFSGASFNQDGGDLIWSGSQIAEEGQTYSIGFDMESGSIGFYDFNFTSTNTTGYSFQDELVINSRNIVITYNLRNKTLYLNDSVDVTSGAIDRELSDTSSEDVDNSEFNFTLDGNSLEDVIDLTTNDIGAFDYLFDPEVDPGTHQLNASYSSENGIFGYEAKQFNVLPTTNLSSTVFDAGTTSEIDNPDVQVAADFETEWDGTDITGPDTDVSLGVFNASTGSLVSSKSMSYNSSSSRYEASFYPSGQGQFDYTVTATTEKTVDGLEYNDSSTDGSFTFDDPTKLSTSTQNPENITDVDENIEIRGAFTRLWNSTSVEPADTDLLLSVVGPDSSSVVSGQSMVFDSGDSRWEYSFNPSQTGDFSYSIEVDSTKTIQNYALKQKTVSGIIESKNITIDSQSEENLIDPGQTTSLFGEVTLEGTGQISTSEIVKEWINNSFSQDLSLNSTRQFQRDYTPSDPGIKPFKFNITNSNGIYGFDTLDVNVRPVTDLSSTVFDPDATAELDNPEIVVTGDYQESWTGADITGADTDVTLKVLNASTGSQVSSKAMSYNSSSSRYEASFYPSNQGNYDYQILANTTKKYDGLSYENESFSGSFTFDNPTEISLDTESSANVTDVDSAIEVHATLTRLWDGALASESDTDLLLSVVGPDSSSVVSGQSMVFDSGDSRWEYSFDPSKLGTYTYTVQVDSTQQVENYAFRNRSRTGEVYSRNITISANLNDTDISSTGVTNISGNVDLQLSDTNSQPVSSEQVGIWIADNLLTGSGFYNFTTCGATGPSGPSQSDCDSAYSGTSLENSVNVVGDGIQEWTVPASTTYNIYARGGAGGQGCDTGNPCSDTTSPGRGAIIEASFELDGGETLQILTGQKGIDANDGDGGGGGGGASFIAPASDSESPYLIAGGGGGAAEESDASDANTGTSGVNGAGTGGQNGEGGSGGYAGGGLYSAGDGSEGGQALTNGGLSGTADEFGGSTDGGFGGAGAGYDCCGGGGGGGYSGGGSGTGISAEGGGGGSWIDDSALSAATSDGSFNDGSSADTGYSGTVDDLNNWNTGQGLVRIRQEGEVITDSNGFYSKVFGFDPGKHDVKVNLTNSNNVSGVETVDLSVYPNTTITTEVTDIGGSSELDAPEIIVSADYETAWNESDVTGPGTTVNIDIEDSSGTNVDSGVMTYRSGSSQYNYSFNPTKQDNFTYQIYANSTDSIDGLEYENQTISGSFTFDDPTAFDLNADFAEGVFEKGEVKTHGSGYVTVPLENTYTSPVVVVTGQTGADEGMALEASRPVIRNTGGGDFEVKVVNDRQETLSSSVAYIVMEEGHYVMDGVEIEAGTDFVGSGYSAEATRTINFQQNFGSTPLVTDSFQDACGGRPLSSRYPENTWSTGSFDYWLEDYFGSSESSWSCSGYYGYIAVEEGASSESFEAGEIDNCSDDPDTGAWCQATFSNSYTEEPFLFTNPLQDGGSDKALVGRKDLTTTSVLLRPTESRATDTEQSHGTSDIPWFAWSSIKPVDVESSATLTAELLALWDGDNFDDSSTTVDITVINESDSSVVVNNQSMTYDSGQERWEYNFAPGSTGDYTYNTYLDTTETAYSYPIQNRAGSGVISSENISVSASLSETKISSSDLATVSGTVEEVLSTSMTEPVENDEIEVWTEDGNHFTQFQDIRTDGSGSYSYDFNYDAGEHRINVNYTSVQGISGEEELNISILPNTTLTSTTGSNFQNPKIPITVDYETEWNFTDVYGPGTDLDLTVTNSSGEIVKQTVMDYNSSASEYQSTFFPEDNDNFDFNVTANTTKQVDGFPYENQTLTDTFSFSSSTDLTIGTGAPGNVTDVDSDIELYGELQYSNGTPVDNDNTDLLLTVRDKTDSGVIVDNTSMPYDNTDNRWEETFNPTELGNHTYEIFVDSTQSIFNYSVVNRSKTSEFSSRNISITTDLNVSDASSTQKVNLSGNIEKILNQVESEDVANQPLGIYIDGEKIVSAEQQFYNFTTCGSTGSSGPSQSQCDSAYSGSTLEGSVNIASPGIQEWSPPYQARYRIKAAGGQGGDQESYSGGRGAVIDAEFEFDTDQQLNILVGQQGLDNPDTGIASGGGGGGTFVANGSDYTSASPLLVAGGGGPANENGNIKDGRDAVTTSYGGDGDGTQGGDNGNGGDGSPYGAGGAGFYTNGNGGDSSTQRGEAFQNGGLGGTESDNQGADSGFGGGSSGLDESGGGGGYSGGGAGDTVNGEQGAGGGSWIDASAITAATSDGSFTDSSSADIGYSGSVSNLGEWNTGAGYVDVALLEAPYTTNQNGAYSAILNRTPGEYEIKVNFSSSNDVEGLNRTNLTVYPNTTLETSVSDSGSTEEIDGPEVFIEADYQAEWNSSKDVEGGDTDLQVTVEDSSDSVVDQGAMTYDSSDSGYEYAFYPSKKDNFTYTVEANTTRMTDNLPWENQTTSDSFELLNYTSLDVRQNFSKTNAVADTMTVDSGVWQTISLPDFNEPVVVGTAGNTGNGNGLITEVRNVDSTSAEIRVCDSSGGDGCEASTGHELNYLAVDAANINSADGIEAGTFSVSGGIDSDSTAVSYSEGFGTAPIPFTTVQTDNGASPVDSRGMENTASGFSGRICHQDGSDSCDSGHAEEEVGYVSIEPGNSPFPNSEIGSSGNSISGSSWYSVTFSSSFSSTPVGLAATLTDNGGQEPEIDEVRNVDTSGMEIRYCELQSGDNCDGHTSEDIGYGAITPGSYEVGSEIPVIDVNDSIRFRGEYDMAWNDTTLEPPESSVSLTTENNQGIVLNNDSFTFNGTKWVYDLSPSEIGNYNYSVYGNSTREIFNLVMNSKKDSGEFKAYNAEIDFQFNQSVVQATKPVDFSGDSYIIPTGEALQGTLDVYENGTLQTQVSSNSTGNFTGNILPGTAGYREIRIEREGYKFDGIGKEILRVQPNTTFDSYVYDPGVTPELDAPVIKFKADYENIWNGSDVTGSGTYANLTVYNSSDPSDIALENQPMSFNSTNSSYQYDFNPPSTGDYSYNITATSKKKAAGFNYERQVGSGSLTVENTTALEVDTEDSDNYIDVDRNSLEFQADYFKIWNNESFTKSGSETVTRYESVKQFTGISDWSGGSFKGTTPSGNDNSGDLGLGYLNGTSAGASYDTGLNDNSLIGYWRMDRSVSGDGGTARDYSGQSNNGIYRNGTSTGVNGILGTSAASFDGSDDFIGQTGVSADTLPVTYSVWTKPKNHTFGYFLGAYNGSRELFFRVGTDRKVGFGTYELGGTENNGMVNQVDYPVNQWGHFTAVATDEGGGIANYTLYHNGSYINSTVANWTAPDNLDVYMGAGNDGGSPWRFFNGTLDEARVYDRALTGQEVKELYLDGKPFNGNYTTSKIDTGGQKNWGKVNINSNIPGTGNLDAEFRALDGGGSVLGTDSFEITDTTENYSVSVPDSEDAEVFLEGTSSDITESWTVDSLEVYEENQISVAPDSQEASFQNQKDWSQGIFRGASADRNDNSGNLGIGYLNGTSAGASYDTGLNGNNLQAYWRMDSNVAGDGGTVKDYSGQGNDGTTNSSVTTADAGVLGTDSFNFDGSNDFVNVSHDTSIGPQVNDSLTVSTWIKADTTGGRWLEKGNSYFLGWGSDLTGDYDYPVFLVKPDNRIVQDNSVNMTAGQWYHIVGVFEGSTQTMRIYTNGELGGTESVGISEIQTGDNLPLVLGADDGGGGQYFDGNVDEVRIYDRALGEQEIEELYFEGVDGTFEGNYTAERVDTSSQQNWSGVYVDADVPASTELGAEFRALDGGGSVVGSDSFMISGTPQNYSVSVPDSEDAEVFIKGNSTDVTQSWEINSLGVFTDSDGTSEASDVLVTLRNSTDDVVLDNASMAYDADGEGIWTYDYDFTQLGNFTADIYGTTTEKDFGISYSNLSRDLSVDTRNISVDADSNVTYLETNETVGFNGSAVLQPLELASNGSKVTLFADGDRYFGNTLDFESGTGGEWYYGGEADWSRTTAEAYDGSYSFRPGVIGDSSTSWVERNITGPRNISFRWKASSESAGDYLQFYVDEGLADEVSGSTSWIKETFSVPSGTHTLRWEYFKDQSVSSGDDTGYVDLIKFRRPVITNQTGGFGVNVSPSAGIRDISFNVTDSRNISGIDSERVVVWANTTLNVSEEDIGSTPELDAPLIHIRADYEKIWSGELVNSSDADLSVTVRDDSDNIVIQNASMSLNSTISSYDYDFRPEGPGNYTYTVYAGSNRDINGVSLENETATGDIDLGNLTELDIGTTDPENTVDVDDSAFDLTADFRRRWNDESLSDELENDLTVVARDSEGQLFLDNASMSYNTFNNRWEREIDVRADTLGIYDFTVYAQPSEENYNWSLRDRKKNSNFAVKNISVNITSDAIIDSGEILNVDGEARILPEGEPLVYEPIDVLFGGEGTSNLIEGFEDGNLNEYNNVQSLFTSESAALDGDYGIGTNDGSMNGVTWREDITVSQGQSISAWALPADGDVAGFAFGVQGDNQGYSALINRTSEELQLRENGTVIESQPYSFSSQWYKIQAIWPNNGNITVRVFGSGGQQIEARLFEQTTTFENGNIGWFMESNGTAGAPTMDSMSRNEVLTDQNGFFNASSTITQIPGNRTIDVSISNFNGIDGQDSAGYAIRLILENGSIRSEFQPSETSIHNDEEGISNVSASNSTNGPLDRVWAEIKPETVQPGELNLYYKMDEDVNGNGDAVEDATPNNQDGVTEDGVQTYLQGRFRRGMSFGQEGFIEIPDGNYPTGEMTLSSWVKLDGFGGSLFNNYDNDSLNLGISETGELFFQTKHGSQDELSNLTTGYTVPRNEWVRITAVYSSSSGEKKVFAGQERVGYSESQKLEQGLSGTGAQFILGRNYGVRSLNGTVDEVKVWSKALNDRAVTKNHYSRIYLDNTSSKNVSQVWNTTFGTEDKLEDLVGSYTAYYNANDSTGLGSEVPAPETQFSVDCAPPHEGNWTLNSSCTMDQTDNLPEDLLLESNRSLNLAPDIKLGTNLSKQSLRFDKDSNITFQPGARIW